MAERDDAERVFTKPASPEEKLLPRQREALERDRAARARIAREEVGGGREAMQERLGAVAADLAGRLPSRAVLERRFPRLRCNRMTGRWHDEQSGARGETVESLLAYLEANRRGRR